MQGLLTLSDGFLSSCLASREDVACCGQDAVLATTAPVHHQYADLGWPEVVLSCPALKATSHVEWRMNGTSAAGWTEAREGDHLVLLNASLADDGEYTCHDAATGQILRKIHLKLGYPPDKPVVQCRSISYAAINCSWCLETETHLATSFISTYRHGLEGEAYECPQSVPMANVCSITNLQLFSTDPYMLNVTAINPLGTATTLSFIFLDQIIKPDPPEDVKVSPINKERKKLLLTWKPPGSWLLPEYFPLKYSIKYSVDGSNNSKRVSRTIEETSFTLTGIRPGVIYHVQVAARDALDNGEDSDWSLPASGTAWAPE
ncbi:interleukin-27 subunit beta isoform X1 [Pogona vitticeps]